MKMSQVGISFLPYIYNTNVVSANSLNKVAGIEEDALKSSVDYSLDKNENLLKLGETSNFEEILEMQFQLGRNHAARVMKTMTEVEEIEYNVFQELEQNMDVQSVKSVEAASNETSDLQLEVRGGKIKEDLISKNTEEKLGKTMSFSKENGNVFLMKKAIAAYTMTLAM